MRQGRVDAEEKNVKDNYNSIVNSDISFSDSREKEPLKTK